MSDIARLRERVRARLEAQAATLGLNAATLAITPILNWGGFVNRSFQISDGRRRLFLKMTSDPGNRIALERWRSVAAQLASRYHAPRMVGWIDLAEPPFSGPLFEWIEGTTPAALDETLAGEIGPVIRHLHEDDALCQELDGPGLSCTEAYLGSYQARFVEDMAFVAADPPPFVDRPLIEWLNERVESLATRARERTVFQMPGDRPVHGDLWLNNVLIDDRNRWHLLDWDGIRRGDPVIDWAMLFGPTHDRPYAANVDDVIRRAALDREEGERLEVYVEASQLDWVIDPLSDWVESAREPEHGGAIRSANARVHRQALEAYRERYG